MPKRPSKYLIYGLTEPGTFEVRYVGRSSKGLREPERYRNDPAHTHRGNWIRSLAKKGKTYDIIVLEQFIFSDDVNMSLNEAEISWISAFKKLGFRLTNMTDGGEGCLGLTPSDEAKRKIGLKTKQRWAQPEYKSKVATAISRAGKLKFESRPEEIEKSAMVNPFRKEVICLNTGQLFTSVRRAAQCTGVGRISIRHMCIGKKKSVKGLRFSWA